MAHTELLRTGLFIFRKENVVHYRIHRITWIAAAAALFLCSGSALALGPGGELEERCPQICGSSSCDSDCFWEGSWTKCAIYNGNPANDYDSDGILNTSDNCSCSANPGQEDCDGDGRGDPCDGRNEKWVLHEVNGNICHVDKDEHFGFYNIEFHSKEVYRNVCDNSTCVKKIFETDIACQYGTSEYKCCVNLVNFSGIFADCSTLTDFCGSPKCNF